MALPSAVGRYRIERSLGVGAFASVWLGHDDELRSPVAVKVLASSQIDDLGVRNRFIEEARILRRADSARLVRVHDIGELPDGRPYFVMSYADRGTLAERIVAGGLPADQALPLAREISYGVAVINRLGVIHRDLKPSNVLFQTTPEGGERVLIADLGLAKETAQASGAFTLPVGTPGYMSPEQAKFGGGLDIRSDVYGLGALTYHLLTGQPPGPTPIEPPPSGLRPDLTPAIDGVVMRALEKDREKRWSSADEFADAIERLGITPPPPPGNAAQGLDGNTVPVPKKTDAPKPAGPTTAIPIPPEPGDPERTVGLSDYLPPPGVTADMPVRPADPDHQQTIDSPLSPPGSPAGPTAPQSAPGLEPLPPQPEEPTAPVAPPAAPAVDLPFLDPTPPPPASTPPPPTGPDATMIQAPGGTYHQGEPPVGPDPVPDRGEAASQQPPEPPPWWPSAQNAPGSDLGATRAVHQQPMQYPGPGGDPGAKKKKKAQKPKPAKPGPGVPGPGPGKPKGKGKGKGLMIIAIIAGAVLLAGGGFGAYTILGGDGDDKKPPPDDNFATIADSGNRIRVSVPKEWAKQADEKWPQGAQISDRAQAPALRATPNAEQFRSLTAPVPGTFIGLTKDMNAQLPPAGFGDHSGQSKCTKGQPQKYQRDGLSGEITPWTKCGQTPITYNEIALKDSGGRFRLWIRVKQAGGTDQTRMVLDSLQITPG